MKSRIVFGITFSFLYLSMISPFAIGGETGHMKAAIQQNAKRITRIHKARYHATADRVFPLLCPVLEYDWLENWQAEMVYSKSGVAELDAIFKTYFEPGETEVWTVTRYEKNVLIEFVMTDGNRVTRFTITLHPNPDGTTDSEWRQVITALNSKGESELEALTEEVYARRHDDISRRLDYFLEHGEMYRNTAH